MLTRITLLSFLGLAVGCASQQPQVRSYDISVKNNSTKPVTLVLAKDGPPLEPVWSTPEDIASHPDSASSGFGLGVVPPGKTASATGIHGNFSHSAKGYIRVYSGDLTLGEMLKVTPGSPTRLDLPLSPGENMLVIEDQGGGIGVAGGTSSTEPTTAPTTSPATEPAAATPPPPPAPTPAPPATPAPAPTEPPAATTPAPTPPPAPAPTTPPPPPDASK